MRNLRSKGEHVSFRVSAFLPALFLISAIQPSQAALYDEHPGSDVQVHYVYLVGYSKLASTTEIDRQNLLDSHAGCVEISKKFNKPYKDLPAEGIPELIHPLDMEIYYSSNRTLTVLKGSRLFVDVSTCEIKPNLHHTRELLSAIGRCTIDLVKKEAWGVCDIDAHASAPNSKRSSLPSDRSMSDLSKVPPHLRAGVMAQYERTNKSGVAPVLTGEQKTIADYKCDVRRAGTLEIERCVSNPERSFPIPASFHNGGIPGLLLEIKSPTLNLQAREVKTSLGISQTIFTIPKGLKVRSVVSPRHL